ncbi:ferritin-like domain-containing protein [Kitasatospora acidiphila]|uniref:ferritin-like domain-containing protein n=1 Tax=Kitasatospora acidiphila TaxID=2567942 RepID=UPI003C77A9B6
MQSPSRRTFLATGALTAAGLLAACTAGSRRGSGSGGGAHDRAGAPKADPDLPLRTRAVAGADALLAQYAAVPVAAAGGAPLAQLQTEVTAERGALATGLPGGGAAGASGSPSSAAPSAGHSPSGSPAGAAGLAAAEKSTALARLADLPTASPELARLLAAVAAAGALRAVRLGDQSPLPAPTDQSSSATPSASGSPGAADPPSADATAALQAALAAEHAAVYAFGVVGAKLPPGPKRDDARACYAAHQARRDAWDRLLNGTGATPTAAAPGYRLPFPVPDATAAGQLAAEVEKRLTAVYGDLVAAATGDLRARAAAALSTAVLQCAHWGGTAGPLPGMPAAAAPSGSPR